MSRKIFFLLLGLALLLAGCFILQFQVFKLQITGPPGQTSPKNSASESDAAVCPWREPEKDLKILFPTATGYKVEKRILSALRREVEQKLGHPLTSDDKVLQVHRIFLGEEFLGSILLRRVRGEYGAIEIVLAVTRNGKINGVRVQRSREPETISITLSEATWLQSFQGKTVASPMRLGEDIPAVPDEAKNSALALLEAIRVELILLDFSAQPNVHIVPGASADLQAHH